jgi:hypothetical protein
MATVAKFYGQYPLKAMAGAVNYTSDVVKCALLTSAYTPNQDTHVFFSSVSASEVVGAGYTAGGVTVSGRSVTYDASTNMVILAADVITFPGLTVSDVRYAVVYHDTGNPATSVLAQYHDLGSATYATSQDVVLTPATSSIGGFVVA